MSKKTPNVSDNITRNISFIQNVNGKRRSQRAIRELIANASDDELLSFVEICFNVLRGRLPLNKRNHQRLSKHALQFRRLARCRTAKSAKCILSPQKGDGLPTIAGVLASVLIPLISNLIDKNT